MKTLMKGSVFFLIIVMVLTSCVFYTFDTAQGIGGTIAAGETVNFPVEISVTGTMLGDLVSVTINNLYSYDAMDAHISLVSPKGTEIALSDGEGGSYYFNGDYIFRQQDYNDTYPLITAAGYSNDLNLDMVIDEGTYVSEGDLARFFGENPNGTWYLRVRNTDSLYSISFTNFIIEYAY